MPLDRLNAAAIRDALLPSRGGLLQDRFLKRGLLLAHDLMQTSLDRARLGPQFILISSLGQSGRHEEDLADFLCLAPDARVILAEDTDGQFQREDLISHRATAINAPPVHLWRWENHYEASLANAPDVLTFPGGRHGTPQIYDPPSHQFLDPPPAAIIPCDSHFADGVRTWAAVGDADSNTKSLVSLSKQTGILIPSSSYIAVESAAQQRAMEEKEKQKIRNNPAYELEDPIATPDPATWLLLGLGLLAIVIMRHRQNLRAPTAKIAGVS